MRQDSKFDGAPITSRRSPLGGRTPAHNSNLYSSAYTCYLSSVANHEIEFGAGGGSLVANHDSPITAFLIDTLAIRITPKSFHCNAALHSNRHSSGASRLHQNWAFPLGVGRDLVTSKADKPTLSTVEWSPARHERGRRVTTHQSLIALFLTASAEPHPKLKNSSKLPFSHTNSTLFVSGKPRCYPSKIALGREFS
jgi:hypothetical protein